jgi:prevent-host-death family protein
MGVVTILVQVQFAGSSGLRKIKDDDRWGDSMASNARANIMSKIIHPLSFLATNTDDVLKEAQETQEPVLITVDGKVEAVVQDVQSYQKTQDQLTMLRILAFGRRQIEAGKVTDHDIFAAQMAAEYPDGEK